MPTLYHCQVPYAIGVLLNKYEEKKNNGYKNVQYIQ